MSKIYLMSNGIDLMSGVAFGGGSTSSSSKNDNSSSNYDNHDNGISGPAQHSENISTGNDTSAMHAQAQLESSLANNSESNTNANDSNINSSNTIDHILHHGGEDATIKYQIGTSGVDVNLEGELNCASCHRPDDPYAGQSIAQ